MLKASETITNTQFYNLHSGNHNELGNPHSQYLLQNNTIEGSKVIARLNNVKLYANFVDVTLANGVGTIDVTLDSVYSSWCSCLSCNVEQVDGTNIYIDLYNANGHCPSNTTLKVMVKSPTDTTKTKARIRYILIGV